MRVHLVKFTARTTEGKITRGTARVETTRNRPSWRECAQTIPGYIRGEYVSLAPESDTFTVSYSRGGVMLTWRDRTHAQTVKLTQSIAERAIQTGGVYAPTVVNSAGDFVTRQFPALAFL